MANVYVVFPFKNNSIIKFFKLDFKEYIVPIRANNELPICPKKLPTAYHNRHVNYPEYKQIVK